MAAIESELANDEENLILDASRPVLWSATCVTYVARELEDGGHMARGDRREDEEGSGLFGATISLRSTEAWA